MKHFLTRVVLLAFRVSLQGLSAHFKQNMLKKFQENASLGKRNREKLPLPESYLTSEASLNIPSSWESRLKCKKLRKYHPRSEKDAQTLEVFKPELKLLALLHLCISLVLVVLVVPRFSQICKISCFFRHKLMPLLA